VRVRVPASSANLGPGFDALGMALALFLDAGLQPLAGLAADPAGDRHPTVVAFRRLGGDGPVWVRSPIPMGRGLGFSGAARVAGLLLAVAQRHGADAPVGDAAVADAADEVLAAAVALEGHADNVAASLYGGVVVTAADVVVPVPLAFDPAVVVWVPDAVKTSTDESRARLRRPVAFDDAVFNVGRAAMLVAALASGTVSALGAATADRLHQDVRFDAVPASRAARDALLAAGAWCAWLSGSGPSVAGLCALDRADAVAAAARTEGGHVKVLRIDHGGAAIHVG
jgi:homoserine kinase